VFTVTLPMLVRASPSLAPESALPGVTARQARDVRDGREVSEPTDPGARPSGERQSANFRNIGD
jgi:hypothetical protein